MRGYLSYFRIRLIMGLQYRSAAIAGICTQFFWGIMYCMLYQAFYKSANIEDINIKEIMCYVWLNQSFIALIFIRIKDGEIIEQIKNGTIAYELSRPYKLYIWWFIKWLAKKYSECALRCLPILILGFLLPAPYNLTLPPNHIAFILFLITLVLGSIVITSLVTLIQIFGLFINEETGLVSIFCTIGELLSGLQMPIPLLPQILKNITEFLPFRLVGDLPFRIYSGNIGVEYALSSISLQIIWIIILIFIGNILINKALRRICIQGG